MIVTGSAVELPLKENSVHMAVFSPPYNCGITYSEYNDHMPWLHYAAMADNVARELARVLVPGGRVWCNVQHVVPDHTFEGKRYNLLWCWDSVLRRQFEYRDTIAWIQDSHDGGTAWGSWLSPAAPNLRGGWEAITVYSKGAWSRTSSSTQTTQPRHQLGGDWTDLCRNVWQLAPERDRGRSPAAFPIELPARAIRLSTWPGEVVLDPFGGSGTTAEACQILERECISLDISFAQSQIAADRLNTLF